MYDNFYDKFKHKTSTELQHIVDNPSHFQPSAVVAASKILSEHKKGSDVALTNRKKEFISYEYTDDFSPLFDPRPFLKNTNSDDFLTWVSIALCWLAVRELLGLYANERIFSDGYTGYIWSSLVFMIILNHCLYRYDHQRINNYIGRVIADVILGTLFLFFNEVYDFLIDVNHEWSSPTTLIGFLGAWIIMSATLELIIGLFIWPFARDR